MLLRISSLLFLFCAINGAPKPAPFYEYLAYLPPSVSSFVNKTYHEASEVVYDLYDDVKEEIIEKAGGDVQQIGETILSIMNQLNQISDRVDGLMEEKMSGEDYMEVQKMVAELQAEVRRDMFTDKWIEDDVEKMIQQYLTAVRSMMIKWTYEDKQLFSNLQKIEKEFIKANEAIASGTGDLKEQISGLFDTLRDIDLNKIGEIEEATTDRVPRNF